MAGPKDQVVHVGFAVGMDLMLRLKIEVSKHRTHGPEAETINRVERLQVQPSLYLIQYARNEWPRKGIVATAHSYVPYCDTDTKEQNRVDRILGRRQFEALQLVWDKNNGVFVKGAKTKDHLNGKKPRGESP